jgi:hypothetical protein
MCKLHMLFGRILMSYGLTRINKIKHRCISLSKIIKNVRLLAYEIDQIPVGGVNIDSGWA